jgi:hypothetical protein
MSRVKGAKNVYQAWLYDTNTVAAAPTLTTEQRFFAVPEGQGGKTARDTNMEVGGQLTGVNSFQIRSWVLKMEDLTKTGNAKLIQNGAFTMIINSVEIPDPIPIEFVMGGASLLESVRGAAAMPEFRAVAGPGNITNVLSFTRPFLVTIDPGDTFAVILAWSGGISPDESVRLRVLFLGRRTKPIM